MGSKIKKINKNVSLIGFMGSGKSTTGKILAEKLNFLFIDLDTVIEISEKMPVYKIFEKKGEEAFRVAENEVIRKIYGNTGCVFSCGGGVILLDKNMKIIRENSIVAYLSVKPENVYKRLKDAKDRPLLNFKDREKVISDMLKSREPLYKKYADIIIETDDTAPQESANIILKILKNKIVVK